MFPCLLIIPFTSTPSTINDGLKCCGKQVTVDTLKSLTGGLIIKLSADSLLDDVRIYTYRFICHFKQTYADRFEICIIVALT